MLFYRHKLSPQINEIPVPKLLYHVIYYIFHRLKLLRAPTIENLSFTSEEIFVMNNRSKKNCKCTDYLLRRWFKRCQDVYIRRVWWHISVRTDLYVDLSKNVVVICWAKSRF